MVFDDRFIKPRSTNKKGLSQGFCFIPDLDGRAEGLGRVASGWCGQQVDQKLVEHRLDRFHTASTATARNWKWLAKDVRLAAQAGQFAVADGS